MRWKFSLLGGQEGRKLTSRTKHGKDIIELFEGPGLPAHSYFCLMELTRSRDLAMPSLCAGNLSSCVSSSANLSSSMGLHSRRSSPIRLGRIQHLRHRIPIRRKPPNRVIIRILLLTQPRTFRGLQTGAHAPIHGDRLLQGPIRLDA